MATVTGLTAVRMQAIINQQISSGAVDLSGNMIFTRNDGSTFNAGAVKGAKGDAAVYDIPGFPTAAVTTYVRLATLDGINATSGAHAEFFLSGIGDYGTARRATMLVHVAQRGADVIDVRLWSWGLDLVPANSIRIFTRKLGSYLYEVWAAYGPYSADPTYMDVSKWNATINVNGNTTTAPTPLVEKTIDILDQPYATATEIMDGTVTNKGVTPKGLRDAGGANPPGSISLFAGSVAPSGFLLCEGAAVSRTTYARLYGVIGTTYGVGDNSTTFNVPNLKGRVPVGLDSADTQFDALGETGGAKTHTLGFAEVPAEKGTRITWGQGNISFNTQPQAQAAAPTGNGLGTYQNDPQYDAQAATRPAGGNPHNNLQPYLVLKYLIKI